jgi:uncharacterized repeat protein (TIGR03803 family)
MLRYLSYAAFILFAAMAITLPAQTFTTLHSFDITDGEYPVTSLVQADNGDLYGTTPEGGANQLWGTIFKITPAGVLTTIYSFCAQSGCPDGGRPNAILQTTNGHLYGTTARGGADADGTVFEITPGGTLTTIYSFCVQSGCADGEEPVAGLVQAAGGDLLRIPTKVNTDSEGNANGIPGRRRTALGA